MGSDRLAVGFLSRVDRNSPGSGVPAPEECSVIVENSALTEREPSLFSCTAVSRSHALVTPSLCVDSDYTSIFKVRLPLRKLCDSSRFHSRWQVCSRLGAMLDRISASQRRRQEGQPGVPGKAAYCGPALPTGTRATS